MSMSSGPLRRPWGRALGVNERCFERIATVALFTNRFQRTTKISHGHHLIPIATHTAFGSSPSVNERRQQEDGADADEVTWSSDLRSSDASHFCCKKVSVGQHAP